MPTTALIVEVLVIGALALMWLVTMFAAVLPIPSAAHVTAAVSLIREMAPLLALPTLALTYAIGWIVNFCSERMLKAFFQGRIRDKRFVTSARYETAKVTVLQCGSSELVHDLLVDRHIIRLARGGIVNFAFMAAALSAHALQGRAVAWPFAFLCAVLAALSFAQWLTRYRSHYARIECIAEYLANNTPEQRHAV